jgi:hypothetical protein
MTRQSHLEWLNFFPPYMSGNGRSRGAAGGDGDVRAGVSPGEPKVMVSGRGLKTAYADRSPAKRRQRLGTEA